MIPSSTAQFKNVPVSQPANVQAQKKAALSPVTVKVQESASILEGLSWEVKEMGRRFCGSIAFNYALRGVGYAVLSPIYLTSYVINSIRGSAPTAAGLTPASNTTNVPIVNSTPVPAINAVHNVTSNICLPSFKEMAIAEQNGFCPAPAAQTVLSTVEANPLLKPFNTGLMAAVSLPVSQATMLAYNIASTAEKKMENMAVNSKLGKKCYEASTHLPQPVKETAKKIASYLPSRSTIDWTTRYAAMMTIPFTTACVCQKLGADINPYDVLYGHFWIMTRIVLPMTLLNKFNNYLEKKIEKMEFENLHRPTS